MRTAAGAVVDPWALPERVPVGGKMRAIRADFRSVLQVLQALNDENLPLFARWRRALFLFYEAPIEPENRQQAMEQLSLFVTCGQPGEPGPKLLDWHHDGQLIASSVNAVAGKELRQEKFVHWWTFLGYFHAIGEGPLAFTVSIRDKLARGKKLTAQQRQWYSMHKNQIRLPLSAAEQAHKNRLEEILKGGNP